MQGSPSDDLLVEGGETRMAPDVVPGCLHYLVGSGMDAEVRGRSLRESTQTVCRSMVPPHAPDGQAIAAQALHHRDPIPQAEVTYGVGAHSTPIARQCSGPYLLLSCRLHPRATQSQDGASGHAASGLALSIICVNC